MKLYYSIIAFHLTGLAAAVQNKKKDMVMDVKKKTPRSLRGSTRQTMMVGGPPDEHGCYISAGETWCPETDKCIRPSIENCPIEGDVSFEGPVTITCEDGRCSANDGEKCQIDMGSWTMGGLYLEELNGEYNLTANCSVDCTGCIPQQAMNFGGPPDEHGCYPSAGETWCPETDECIRPWMEICPIKGDVSFDGPVSITCNGGRCSANDGEPCIIDMGSWTAGGLYLDELNGEYNLTANCSVDCTGCVPQQTVIFGGPPDEHGCYASAGETWCPETDKCIHPWMENCPIKGDVSFEGPATITCEDGRCSANDGKECIIDMGSWTMGGLYLEELNGEYNVTKNCSVDCTGCVPKQ